MKEGKPGTAGILPAVGENLSYNSETPVSSEL